MVDFSNWATKELGLAKAGDLPIRKVYSSGLNFSLSKQPALFNPALAAFFDAANAATGTDMLGKSDFLQLDLGTDQNLKNPNKFTIAREVNTPIADNRYYSFAPTTTQVHIAILEKLEKLSG